MTMPHVDPKLVLAWQTAHSVARSSPPPVHDCGGFRVDTHSEKEVKRWVFPQLCDGLRAVAREITAPRHYLKLCGSDEDLQGAVPSHWELQPTNYLMLAAVATADTKPLPTGYRMEFHQAGPVTRASIIAPDGDVAASGCAAETADVFIYDRIETAQGHRRKGLGAAVMIALGAARKSLVNPQLLAATEDGRHLYGNLGWTVLAPFSAASIPEG
jgi:hypothetical protein